MNALQKDLSAGQYENLPLKMNTIHWCPSQRALYAEPWSVRFTPTEYRLLFPLRHGYPMSYAQLAMMVYNCSIDAKVREMMDKHMDHIRGKLEGVGLYVYCVFGYGYVLLPSNT